MSWCGLCAESMSPDCHASRMTAFDPKRSFAERKFRRSLTPWTQLLRVRQSVLDDQLGS